MYEFTAYTNICTAGYVQIRSELRADTNFYTYSYNQVYVSGRFCAQITNRDRPIYCIHSVKYYWAPALGTPSAALGAVSRRPRLDSASESASIAS